MIKDKVTNVLRHHRIVIMEYPLRESLRSGDSVLITRDRPGKKEPRWLVMHKDCPLQDALWLMNQMPP